MRGARTCWCVRAKGCCLVLRAPMARGAVPDRFCARAYRARGAIFRLDRGPPWAVVSSGRRPARRGAHAS
eukprot:11223457-Lingulodinium_polyedra.AAC.1